MKRVWTDKMTRRLKQDYPVKNLNLLSNELGVTRIALKSKAKILGIKRSDLAKIWTKERKQQLADLYPNHTNAEVAEILGTTESSISMRAFNQRLLKLPEFHERKRSAGYFPKGHQSTNKGKKWSEFMSEKGQTNSSRTTFRKGHTPQNHKPIGSTRIDTEGYLYEKIAEPKKWELKHRLVWQEHHGVIPKGYNVQFKDSNRLNCDIENLYLISRNEQIAQNSIVRYPNEIRTALMRIGKLNKLIRKHENID